MITAYVASGEKINDKQAADYYDTDRSAGCCSSPILPQNGVHTLTVPQISNLENRDHHTQAILCQDEASKE